MNFFGTTANKLIENQRFFLNTIELPALLLQSEPRQVVTANNKACELFGKDLSQIEGYKGGQVFNCIHSFTEAGCGKDINCEDCKIKNAVVDTFTTGEEQNFVETKLDIKKIEEIIPYDIQVSTKKIGDFVVVAINKYTVSQVQ